MKPFLFSVLVIVFSLLKASAAELSELAPYEAYPNPTVRYRIPKGAKKGSGAEETNFYWCREETQGVTNDRFRCTIFSSEGFVAVDGTYKLRSERVKTDAPLKNPSAARLAEIGYDSGGIDGIYLNQYGKLVPNGHINAYVKGGHELRFAFEEGKMVEVCQRPRRGEKCTFL